MVIRRAASAEMVQEVVTKSGMPRNQVAALSGLSNTYIRDLESGNFTNVGRKNLIALAAALSLDLPTIDRLLRVFDRTGLTADDIPAFLAVPNRSRLSSAPLPLRGFFATDLFITAQESIPGNQILFSVWPPYALKAEGHRSYTERFQVKSHPIYGDLIEAIGRARELNIASNLVHHRFDQYLCKECLNDYIRYCQDAQELIFRRHHIKNLMTYSEEFENFRVFLVDRCPTFVINLKTPDPATKQPERLTLSNTANRHQEGRHPDQVAGFIIQNKGFIDVYKQELLSLEQAIDDAYVDRNKLIDHLAELIAEKVRGA